jgi:hypothetical protein
MNIDKLRKIKALAESGGMEAPAAQQMLEKLMALHSIDKDALEENRRKYHAIGYNRAWEKMLWLLVIEFVLDIDEIRYLQGNRFIEVEMSASEFFAAETLFNAHSPHVRATYLAMRDRYTAQIKEAKEALNKLEYVAVGYAQKNNFYVYPKGDRPANPKPTPQSVQQVASEAYWDSPVIRTPKALLES